MNLFANKFCRLLKQTYGYQSAKMVGGGRNKSGVKD